MHKALYPIQWVLLCLKSKSRCLLGFRCALRLCIVMKASQKAADPDDVPLVAWIGSQPCE